MIIPGSFNLTCPWESLQKELYQQMKGFMVSRTMDGSGTGINKVRVNQ